MAATKLVHNGCSSVGSHPRRAEQVTGRDIRLVDDVPRTGCLVCFAHSFQGEGEIALGIAAESMVQLGGG